jgi:hypothetical protein
MQKNRLIPILLAQNSRIVFLNGVKVLLLAGVDWKHEI